MEDSVTDDDHRLETSHAPATITVQHTNPQNGDGSLVAPGKYQHLTIRTQWPMHQAYKNLLYEGNNKGMRGDQNDDGTYPISALDIAERWRAWARAGRGVFLLRDSLWNQQDHAGRYPPLAMMLSPSWVTVAVHEVSLGNAVPRLGIPDDPDDDAAWTALSPDEIFGEFPPSETLHDWATRSTSAQPDNAGRIEATRNTLVVLDGLLARLEEEADEGPDAVAQRGAELISRSDRNYFTPELRRDKFIPLLVENPYPHELNDEGKSFRVSGREVPDDILSLTRSTVLRRRLADGDIAIERYDISRQAELDHLVDVLQPLVPLDEPGNTVWVWVTGPVEEEGEWLGPRALDYREQLESALEAGDLNRDRIRIVTRHAQTLDGGTPLEELAAEVEDHRDAGWTLRLNMRTSVLESTLESLASK